MAQKHDASDKRGPGRPPLKHEIAELIVRMAEENPGWGYTKIRDAVHGVGHIVARTTVRNVLQANGIVPAPESKKRTHWRDFLRSHWEVLAAADFFTVEVWTARGLVTQYVLFVIPPRYA